ncbi:Crp/Fnr family transcriptional regulator [Hyphomicrobium sp.]|uniref:Crp/Fnr family transcriptional regulator n=1 Tax=Hyphomicrobium sp. TaxID=82 RepID=UPI001E128DC4|nr:Crp/Fnr family transcriptional regulator [Hyphomicrobium sp.]MBY0558655.1 Crp/Fnr family transcriptional regulator [Hyphomicrobium sp.]
MLRPGSGDAGSKILVRRVPGRHREAGKIRTLARDELLFETGDLKTNVYRVEAGALCISCTRRDGTMEIVEYALAGDVVGMGFLERHACSARASVKTVVRCFRLDATDKLIASDAHNKARFDEAVEREFVFRRESLARSSRNQPMVRLAAFLTAVSQRSHAEGGDPTFIDDTVNCGVIADFLGLDIEALTIALTQLEARGLIEAAPPHGLRLKDLSALKAVADEQGMTSGSQASDDVLRAALQ